MLPGLVCVKGTYQIRLENPRCRLLVHRRAPLALRLRLLHALDLGKVLLHALQLREDGVALRVCALEFK